MRMKPMVASCLLASGLVLISELSAQQQPTPSQGSAAPVQAPAAGKSLVPDTFTNLQVLPKDIAKKDLVAIMKAFSQTIKQRCSFCHVATDDLSEADFPADEKETKKKARELLRMILDAQKAAAKP